MAFAPHDHLMGSNSSVVSRSSSRLGGGTTEEEEENSGNSSLSLSNSQAANRQSQGRHFNTRRTHSHRRIPAVGGGGDGDGMESEGEDSDSGDNDNTDNGTRRITEDLISVFQVLIRNGQIHIMSSEEDSGDESYSPQGNRKIVPPTEDYAVDTSVLEKNDLKLTMGAEVAIPENGNYALPRLLASREMGNISRFIGFDKAHRNRLSETFLPNTINRVANYGYKAFCGTYSKRGDIFLSASQDRAIRIYDTTNGKFKKFKKIMARDVGWSVLDTAFSPDGRSVIYSSWSESLHLCNIYGDVDRHEALNLCPDNRRFCIFSLTFSDDGSEILGGANDGYLYMYNLESNKRVLKLEAHEDDLNSVAFADQSTHILFSAADDGLCKVWDRRNLRESDPKPVGTLAGHVDGITFIDSKGDGRYLITNSKDQSIKLWDMRVFASQDAIQNTRRLVADQNWDYRWQRVPRKLCIPRNPIDGDVSVMTYRGHSVLNTLIRCRFSPSYSTGQRYIYTGCAAGRVVVYDVLTGKIQTTLKGHRSCVRDVSWHPERMEIVSTSWDNSVGLWTYEGNHALESDEEAISEIELSDGSSPSKRHLRRSCRIAEKRARSERPSSSTSN